MTHSDEVWIKLMEWCSKYWGCHQMPDRSFFLFGYQLPVCARCTGIIIGEILSIPFSFVFNLSPFVLSFFMFPMVIDGIFQLKTSYISTNAKRFSSGLMFGYGFLSLFILLVKWVLQK